MHACMHVKKGLYDASRWTWDKVELVRKVENEVEQDLLAHRASSSSSNPRKDGDEEPNPPISPQKDGVRSCMLSGIQETNRLNPKAILCSSVPPELHGAL